MNLIGGETIRIVTAIDCPGGRPRRRRTRSSLFPLVKRRRTRVRSGTRLSCAGRRGGDRRRRGDGRRRNVGRRCRAYPDSRAYRLSSRTLSRVPTGNTPRILPPLLQVLDAAIEASDLAGSFWVAALGSLLQTFALAVHPRQALCPPSFLPTLFLSLGCHRLTRSRRSVRTICQGSPAIRPGGLATSPNQQRRTSPSLLQKTPGSAGHL